MAFENRQTRTRKKDLFARMNGGAGLDFPDEIDATASTTPVQDTIPESPPVDAPVEKMDDAGMDDMPDTDRDQAPVVLQEPERSPENPDRDALGIALSGEKDAEDLREKSRILGEELAAMREKADGYRSASSDAYADAVEERMIPVREEIRSLDETAAALQKMSDGFRSLAIGEISEEERLAFMANADVVDPFGEKPETTEDPANDKAVDEDIFGPKKEVAARAPADTSAVQRIVGSASPESMTSGVAIQALSGFQGDGGTLTAGDDDPSQQPKASPDPDRAPKFKIPPRPDLWPAFMTWPSDRDVKRLSHPEVTDEQRKEFFDRLEQMPAYMVKRAKMLEQWMEDEGEGATFEHRKFIGGKRHEENRTLNTTQTDPFRQIHWATLLDPLSHGSASLQKVSSWSKMRARTTDGGEVLAAPNSVSVTKLSRDALSLAMDEGIARGWKSHKLQGSPDFCKMAIELAREKGITAEIRVQRRPFGLGKSVHVMPQVPPPSREIIDEMMGDLPGRKDSPEKEDSGKKMIAPQDNIDPMGGEDLSEPVTDEDARKKRQDVEYPDGPGM